MSTLIRPLSPPRVGAPDSRPVYQRPLGAPLRHASGEDDAAHAVAAAIDEACQRIAPSWPLDRSIAVNPHWGFTDLPIGEAAARLGTLAASPLTMPRAWHANKLGIANDEQLQRAIDRTGAQLTPREVREALAASDAPLREFPLLPELADELHDVTRHVTWRDYVVQDVSNACGACFGAAQARWSPDTSQGLYLVWRGLAARDVDARLLIGRGGMRRIVQSFPDSALALIHRATRTAGVPQGEWASWFTALLMRVQGWAGACAHRRWEARLRGDDDRQIVELLAVMLAWELVLLGLYRSAGIAIRRDYALDAWRGTCDRLREAQVVDWVALAAVEDAYQRELVQVLRTPGPDATPSTSAQVVFCIDVRSEVLRRAVETVSPTVQTLGFAGFFGIPLAYRRPGAEPRPQLPGLIAPSVVARDVGLGAAALAKKRGWRTRVAGAWSDVLRNASGAFAGVEATGLSDAAALLRRSVGTQRGSMDALRDDVLRGDANATVVPVLKEALSSGAPIDHDARVQLAAGILRAMSLTSDFARLVAFVGHGATTSNNPQGAALACGACGGQSGEVNARALAALLNDPQVRSSLGAEQLHIPHTTWFVAGVHDTVTDRVVLFNVDHLPASHREDARALMDGLERAGHEARRERAPRLGLGNFVDQPERLLRAFEQRAGEWSEVRPEWGLARNAAFIVAPRARTRGRSLDGRVFLHEYRWEQDPSNAVLTQILTAPMVVTHWINMQYYASTVDPKRFGSGDKVLHDVVGAHVGVFEGAGGDLRIGLAEQSVHDGTDWVHEPLRLTVIVEAPKQAIDAILAEHPSVRNLVHNGWVHLLQLEGDTLEVWRRKREGWERFEA